MSTTRPHVLLIDNFDSFSFNLVDAFAVLGAEVEVYRNVLPAERVLELARARGTSLVVLSPGPGSPEEAGCHDGLLKFDRELIADRTGRFTGCRRSSRRGWHRRGTLDRRLRG